MTDSGLFSESSFIKVEYTALWRPRDDISFHKGSWASLNVQWIVYLNMLQNIPYQSTDYILFGLYVLISYISHDTA